MADGFHNNTRTDTSANAAGLFDRVPPHDDNAEMATLGGMLMSKDAIGEVSQIVSVRRSLASSPHPSPRTPSPWPTG